jgi:hypothetical protein
MVGLAVTTRRERRQRIEHMKRRLFISGIFVALLALAFIGLFLRTER